jgi:two-component system, chemotaxis family, CheB/CheR fusion protein
VKTRTKSFKGTAMTTREGLALASRLLEHLHDPAVLLDRNMRIVLPNARFVHLIDQSPERLMGQYILDIGSKALDVQAFRETLDRLASGQPVSHGKPTTSMPRMHEQRTVSAGGCSILTEDLDGHVLIAIKQSADEIGYSRRKTSPLDPPPVSPSLALASHELRQPLQTLSLLQGLLAMKVDTPELQQWISLIGAALGVLTGTLDALVCWSELERSKVEPDFAAVSISSIFARLKPMLAYYAAMRGLNSRIVPSRAIVRSDRRLLEPLLSVLLLSATKLLQKGTVLIGCRPRGEKLRLEFWISGECKPDHQQQLILAALHPDSHSVARDPLIHFFARPLAESLGMSLWARRQPGVGLALAAEFPLCAYQAIVPEPRNASKEIAVAPIKGTILVIADDTSIRDLLELSIRQFGHDTIARPSPTDGLSFIQRADLPPDMIVADVDSYEACLRFHYNLRSKLQAQLPAVILMSEISSELPKAPTFGPLKYLRKPIDMEELKQSIAEMLERHIRRPPLQQRLPSKYPLSPLPTEKQTIYVVEDDRILRHTLQSALQGKNTRFFATCDAFLEFYTPSLSGCLVVDNIMPGMRGVELLERLASQACRLPAIMVTGHGDIPTAVRAMKAGAIDFIQKPITYDALLTAIQSALRSEHDGWQERRSWKQSVESHIASSLTKRERQIMTLVVNGLSSKAIAQLLGISSRTVENHRAAVMKKTGASSIPDLTRMALDLGSSGP